MASSERLRLLPGDGLGGGGAGEGLTRQPFLGWVRVEPVVAASLFGLGLNMALADNLWLDKICKVHFNLSEAVCCALSNHPREEEEVQRLANRYRVYGKVMQQVPAAAMVLLMGGCSDALDRRLPLLWCHTGYLMMALASVANVYWWWLPPQLLLLNHLLLGMAGGTLVLVMGVEAYLSAASASQHRTMRLMLLKVLAVAGKASGMAVALVVFRTGNYLAVFGLQSLVFVFVIVYVLLRLERRPGEDPQQQQLNQQQEAVLSFARLKETVLGVFLASGSGGGLRLLAHMFIVWLLLFSLGSANFVYFSARTRFHWSYETFTLWYIIDVTVSSLGPLVAVPAVTSTFHPRDELLGLLGSFSLLFKNVILATAPRGWVLYLASAAGVCGEVVGVASRASASRVGGTRRVGAVFAVMAVGEAVMPVLAAVAFAALYAASYTIFPGAVFILSAFCCAALSCTLVGYIACENDADINEETEEAARATVPSPLANTPSFSPPAPLTDPTPTRAAHTAPDE